MAGNRYRLTWRSSPVDASFDEHLERVLEGAPPGDVPAVAGEEREAFLAAQALNAALAPARETPRPVIERIWRTVEAGIADAPPPAVHGDRMSALGDPPVARHRRRAVRYSIAAALASALVLLTLLAAPTVQDRWAMHRFLNTAAAATLTIPADRVLHCTYIETYTPAGRPGQVLGEVEAWLDPARQLARIEYRLQRQQGGLNRQVFDGQTLSAYATRGSDGGGREGLYQESGRTYAQFTRHHDCSLADQVADVQQELLRIDPRRSITTSEETLDGVPVLVLSVLMDAKESRTYYAGLRPEPGRSTANLPARYTFTRDGRQLVRVQTWVMTDTAGGVAPVEYQIRHSLDPVEQYPPSFFSVDAIVPPSQP